MHHTCDPHRSKPFTRRKRLALQWQHLPDATVISALAWLCSVDFKCSVGSHSRLPDKAEQIEQFKCSWCEKCARLCYLLKSYTRGHWVALRRPFIPSDEPKQPNWRAAHFGGDFVGSQIPCLTAEMCPEGCARDAWPSEGESILRRRSIPLEDPQIT